MDEIKLTPKQTTIAKLLRSGGKYSAADITILTHFSDPRSHIARMRDKGVKILDDWRDNANKDGRYKVYWIAQ